MGAESFISYAKGKTAKEAFHAACEQAAWEDGHGGYTGTIAEKSSFVLIPTPKLGEDFTVEKYVEHVMWGHGESDPTACAIREKVADKWGPAGCFDCGDGRYIFFGYASS